MPLSETQERFVTFMNTSESPDKGHQKTSNAPYKRKPLNQMLSFWLTILVIVLIIAFIHYRNALVKVGAKHKQQSPVIVALVKTSNIPIYLSALGSVTPTYSVTIRTQINGQLMRVLFKEGQMVKAGDLLAEIDSRLYEAQLTEFKGQLERDQAQLVNARIDLERYTKLWKQDSVSQQILATQQALVKQLEGTIKSDEGLIQATEVNLIYCKITSPIDGRIGLRVVDPGNFVQVSDTSGIAVVNMLNPITVVFSIAEDDIPEVMEKIYANSILTVQAYDRQQNKLLATGQLLTADNQVDSSTGTVRLKAEFQNENNALFPSQFVNIRLQVKTLDNVVVVPTAAIQNSTKSTFVYLMNKDTLTVAVTPVVIGVTAGETTVINSGLSAGQSVVVEGTDKLTDGATVTLSDQTSAATPVKTGKKKPSAA
jgi:multidrug efflux system membrane fusion protein